MQSLTYVIYSEASLAVCGVLETQESNWAKGGIVGVGVRSLISSCDITFSGSNGTRPAPRKPPRPFSGRNVAKNAAWKARKKSGLVIWWI